jgi:hypothetical protein
MNKTTLVLFTALTTLLTGCVVTSIYPFYLPKDLVFEPSLLGTWTNAGQANEHWRFEKDKEKSYRLTCTSGPKTQSAQARLFKLQGQLFMDLFAPDIEVDVQPEPAPTHMLVRVEQLAPTLKLTELDYDWLKQSLADSPKLLRYVLEQRDLQHKDCRFVLTADTEELQKFLIKHLKTPQAWRKCVELGLE